MNCQELELLLADYVDGNIRGGEKSALEAHLAGCEECAELAKDAAVDTFERAYLGALLEACNGNMSKAARTAGMDRMYLHRLVQKHGLRGGGTAGGAPSIGGPPSSTGG